MQHSALLCGSQMVLDYSSSINTIGPANALWRLKCSRLNKAGPHA
jgi:hypothetical protein